MPHSSPLNLQAIEEHLTTKRLGRRIDFHERLDSTNRQAVALAQAGAEHGVLVLADAQTAGRGRMARPWFSPPGLNVYGSLIVRAHTHTQLSWLPLVAALATAQAIEIVGAARIAVKWPNDLLVGDRKVGGILCESGTSSGFGPFQVIGIGINVNGAPVDFPPELRETATTLREETGQSIDRNQLIVHLMQKVESCLEEFLADGAERLASAYRQRCATIGKTVKAMLADGNECLGVAEGIGHDGSLTLRDLPQQGGAPASATRQLRAADITHLR